MCDMTIVLDNGQIEAHRVVLAARSEYFAGLLLGNDDGGDDLSDSHQTNITIPEKLQIMNVIVDYFYTGHCECEPELFVQVYKAADLYGCDRLKGLLANRLASDVTLENVVEMAKLAWDHDDEIMKETLAPLIKENMTKLKERSEFREMLNSGGYADMVIKLFEIE